MIFMARWRYVCWFIWKEKKCDLKEWGVVTSGLDRFILVWHSMAHRRSIDFKFQHLLFFWEINVNTESERIIAAILGQLMNIFFIVPFEFHSGRIPAWWITNLMDEDFGSYEEFARFFYSMWIICRIVYMNQYDQTQNCRTAHNVLAFFFLSSEEQ